MEKVTYTLGIESVVMELEKICSNFFHIEDIELCFFSPYDRYPLDRTKLHHYNKEVVTNYPQLPLYCLPMVKDAIAYAIYRDNHLSKHFFKNVIISEETIQNLKDEEEIRGLEDNKLYYYIPKKYDSLNDIISNNIPAMQFNNIELARVTAYKDIQKNYREQYGDDWIMHKEILEKYIVDTFEYNTKLNDIFADSDIGDIKVKIEILLSLIVDTVGNKGLPRHRTFTIDDATRDIKITFGDSILVRRLKEANLF